VIAWFAGRRIAAWAVLLLVTVLGGLALGRVGISQFPDLAKPALTVQAAWPGASPEAIEQSLVVPIEEAAAQVPDAVRIRSQARRGLALITVELPLGSDVDAAATELRQRLGQMGGRLPREAEAPVVRTTSPDDEPVLALALAGPVPPRVLSDWSLHQVARDLRTVPGVGDVEVVGAGARAVRVWLDARRLQALGIATGEVVDALRRNHLEAAAGSLEDGSGAVSLRLLGEAADLDAFARIPIPSRQGVRIGDVALVEDGFGDGRNLYRVQGEPAQGLLIRKRPGANAVAVADGVMARLPALASALPEGLTLRVVDDRSEPVRHAVHEIGFEIAVAILLTAGVCRFALGGWGATANVILAIPMSLLGAVAVVYLLGWTLNTFTLLGLGLAVGLVVDDAIMVLESIVRRLGPGVPPAVAAVEGTRGIAGAAGAATLAVVAVFSPALVLPGEVGRSFLQFGTALSVAVLLSWVEAVTLTPARCARIPPGAGGHGDPPRWFTAVHRRALARPWLTVAVGVLLCGGGGAAFLALPREIAPRTDQGQLSIGLEGAPGMDLAAMDAAAQAAEAWVRAQPETVLVQTRVWGPGDGVVAGAGLTVGLADGGRERSWVLADRWRSALRREVPEPVKLRTSIPRTALADLPPPGEPVVELRGEDHAQLAAAAERVVEAWRATGLMDRVWTSAAPGPVELRLVPDRDRAADLGLTIADLAGAVGGLTAPVRSGSIQLGGRRAEVVVRLRADQRARRADLLSLPIRVRDGVIPLTSVIDIVEAPSAGTLRRTDRERMVIVGGSLAAGARGSDPMPVLLAAARADLPQGIRVVDAEMGRALAQLISALGWALLGGLAAAGLVLAVQYDSVRLALVALAAAPPAAAGAAVMLWCTGGSLHVITGLGCLLVIGLALKNGILLIDRANQSVQGGMPYRAALLDAAPERFRAVVMTSVVTALAAVPVAVGAGPGAELRAPMARAIIGGIAVSTAVSLLLVPALLALVWKRRMAPV
jgi:multidrug efflux pump subunit AcrB